VAAFGFLYRVDGNGLDGSDHALQVGRRCHHAPSHNRFRSEEPSKIPPQHSAATAVRTRKQAEPQNAALRTSAASLSHAPMSIVDASRTKNRPVTSANRVFRVARLAAVGTFALTVLTSALAHAGELTEEERKIRAIPPEASEPSPAAQQDFDRGKAAMQAGDYEAACAAFARSYQDTPGIGTRYNLAECDEKLGRTASAMRGYQAVEAATRMEAQLARQKKSKVCTLEISKPTNVMVMVDDEAIEANRVLIDPGKHRVVALRDGAEPWSTTIIFSDCPTSQALMIPQLQAKGGTSVAPKPPTQAAKPPSVGKGTAQKPRPAPTNQTNPAYQGHSHSNRGALSAFGGTAIAVGAIGLVTGGIFGISAISLKSKSDKSCNEANVCNKEGLATRSESIRNGNLATGILIVSGIVTVAGLVMVLLDGGSSDNRNGLVEVATRGLRF
jgi:hypothetical protein